MNHPRMLAFCTVCIILLFCGVSSLAEDNSKSAPTLINYQGLLQDSGGNPLQGTYDMVFRICTQEAGGPFDWQEVHAVTNAITTDAKGVFNVILNSTGAASGNLANLLRDSSNLWLEIEVDGETLAPRQRMTSSGFALSAPWSGITGKPTDFADGVDNISTAGDGLDANGTDLLIEQSYRLPQNAITGQVAKWNGTIGQWEPATDENATYSAGTGIQMTGTTFNVVYAGSGTADSAARSDHDHFGSIWSGSSSMGLQILNSSNDSDALGIAGFVVGTGANYGVFGSSTSSSTGSSGVYGRSEGTGQCFGIVGDSRSTGAGSVGVWGASSGGGVGSKGVVGEANSVDAVGVFGTAIGTNSYGVYSDGDAKVDGDLTVTGNVVNDPPKIGFAHIPGSAFRPASHEVDYEISGTKYRRLNGDVILDSDKTASAPIQLPHGATITEVTVFGYTDSPMGPTQLVDFHCILFREQHAALEQVIAQITEDDYPSMPADSYFEFTALSLSNTVVNNETYSYYFWFASHRDLDIMAARVKYTY